MGRAGVLAVLAALAEAGACWPSGAPGSACLQMTPGHGREPQQTPMPYTVTTSNSTVLPGKRMTVTISRGEEPPFRGFFVQVRSAIDPDVSEPLGLFYTRSHTLISCGAGQNNGISHSDNKRKEAVTLLWQAPDSLDTDSVLFRVTVVEEHDRFWVAHDTAPLRVAREANRRPSAPAPATQLPPLAVAPDVSLQRPQQERRTLSLPATETGKLPMLYVVTPTYRRPEQLAELTRLGQTLLTVPRLTWIVVEDARVCSPTVTALLQRLGIPYVHEASPMPARYRREYYAPRGVSARRAAIRHLAALPSAQGTLYFLDDDNAIDIRLFEQIRHTKKVSMFPVGFIGDYRVSSPIVRDGAVTGFFDSWPAGRRFAVDMAGFALNVRLLRDGVAHMPYRAGYEEDMLLQSLNVSLADIEPLAAGCTQVLVWHTKTVKNKPVSLAKEVIRHGGSNVAVLVQNMRDAGMVTG